MRQIYKYEMPILFLFADNEMRITRNVNSKIVKSKQCHCLFVRKTDEMRTEGLHLQMRKLREITQKEIEEAMGTTARF